MPIVHTDLPAIVLESRDHGESDKIITFFCQNIGRLTAIAKGAHRSKKRFVNKLELFTFIQINVSRSSPERLAIITDADLVNSFISIRSTTRTYQAASVIRELSLLAASEQLPDNDLFKLILWALHTLNEGSHVENVTALFLVKLFDCIGYRPDFSSCQHCGLSYQGGGPAVFSIQNGGLICSRCMNGEELTGRRLSSGAIQMISVIQKQSLQKLNRCRLDGIVLREVLDIMYRYGRHLFQRDIHSWKMFTAKPFSSQR